MGDEILTYLQNATWFSLDSGAVSWTVFCAIVVVAQALLLPVSPFSIYAGFSFGFRQGTALMILAKMISALFNFSVSRWVAKDWGSRLASRYPLIQSMNDVVVREGLQFVILLRLCPIPFSIANYGYGLTKIPLHIFITATLVAIIIPTVTLVAFGASLCQGLSVLSDKHSIHNSWQATATGVSVIAMFFVARRVTTVAMQRVKAAKDALPPASQSD